MAGAAARHLEEKDWVPSLLRAQAPEAEPLPTAAE